MRAIPTTTDQVRDWIRGAGWIKRDEAKEARLWLEDCGADCDGRGDGEVLRELDRQYEGGLRAFLRSIRTNA